MGDYGSCDPIFDHQLACGTRPGDLPLAGKPGFGGPMTKPRHGGPIFLENPDGTITEAIPLGHKDKSKVSGRRPSAGIDGDSDTSNGSMSEAAAASMYNEVDFLYARHERIFTLLLVTQLLLEILYDVVYVVRMQPSILEFMAMYNYRIRAKVAEIIFWIIYVVLLVYSVVYYAIAGVAMYTKQPKQYQLFANWSLAGIVGLVFLAYVDKFNLLIFFLRLLAYIYSRFLQGLTASLLLLPATIAA
eukprot:TRINITY_DN5453_c0_g1_i1.p2 TRINITY_DN5453_c0_g1~~TRINITY_DN5453_c0_g1_i1.p2  ORF type:complete len:245 (-),score=41.52 TRINITY_DN5453_c0_g1_i1:68-802(-)